MTGWLLFAFGELATVVPEFVGDVLEPDGGVVEAPADVTDVGEADAPEEFGEG